MVATVPQRIRDLIGFDEDRLGFRSAWVSEVLEVTDIDGTKPESAARKDG